MNRIQRGLTKMDRHEMNTKEYLYRMLKTKQIDIKPFAWCFGYVDMVVSSELLYPHIFKISVLEDDWTGEPLLTVAEELHKLIRSGIVKRK